MNKINLVNCMSYLKPFLKKSSVDLTFIFNNNTPNLDICYCKGYNISKAHNRIRIYYDSEYINIPLSDINFIIVHGAFIL